MSVQLLSVTAIRIGLAPGQPGDKAKGIRPVPPKVRDIAPGTHFVTDEQTAAGLIASGAAKQASLPKAPEVVNLAETEPAPAPAKATKPKAAPKPKATNPAAAAPADAGDGGEGDGLV